MMKSLYRGEDEDEDEDDEGSIPLITSGGKSWDGRELHELNRHESKSSTTDTNSICESSLSSRFKLIQKVKIWLQNNSESIVMQLFLNYVTN